MSETKDASSERDYSLDAVFDALADESRRRLLGFLYDRPPDPLTRRDLATHLAAERSGRSRDEVANEDVRRALANLHHAHLPKLEAAGLVDRDADRNLVTITDHPAFRDAGVVDAIRDRTDADAGSLDALFAALADARRRTVLASLNHSFRRIHVETLARDVAGRERDVDGSAVPEGEIEEVLARLRHVHLPKLARAGLVEYDRDEGTAAYGGHSALRVPWLHSVLEPDFRAHLARNGPSEEVRVIEGREEVVAYSQSLLERADEELFSMFTATDLLESGCFARVLDATRRGVDVYLGTRDPTVREIVCQEAPEITVWEPESDWLDLPVEEDRVSRLLMADREAVMLGTFGERLDDGVYEEKALVGEGPDNTLVAMTRQMLGSRLERIDGETEDVDSCLPF